jgi:hypothetical protein
MTRLMFALVWLCGCTKEAGPDRDLATTPDLAEVADLAGGDLAQQDLATQDLANGDLAPAPDLAPAVTIRIAPASATIGTGEFLPFTAQVMNAAPGVYFYVVPGGAGGTVDGEGLYRAPFLTGTDEVVAVSLADPAATASARVTVVASPVVMISLAPQKSVLNPGQRQGFTATVSGSANSGVFWSVDGGGTIDSDGVFTAGDSFGTFQVSATSMADPSRSASAKVDITSDPQVAVTVSPAPVTLTPGQAQSFSATVTGSGDGSVTWSAGGGSVDANGNYLAPMIAGSFRVTATSNADPTKSDTAMVTVPATEISGTVSYSGARKGRLYVNVFNNGNGLAAGTSLPSPGPFTIRGAPTGPLHLVAWIDTLGVGKRNAAADPSGTLDVSLDGRSLDGISIALTNPTIATPSRPSLVTVVPTNGGVIVVLRQPTDSSNAESNDHYRVYCSTSANPDASNSIIRTTPAGSNIVPVAPLQPGMWTCAASGLVAGSESALSTPSTAMVGPPPAGFTLSGQVSFTGITATGTLFVVAMGGQGFGATSVPNPLSPQSYAVSGLPNSVYQLITFLDQGDDGYLGPTDPALFKAGTGIAVVDGDSVAPLLSFPPEDASVRALTTNDGGAAMLRISVASALKQPVAATLTSAVGIGVPTDLGMDQKYDLNGQVIFGLGTGSISTPKPGDAYSVDVLFSDGGRERLGANVSAYLATPTPLGPFGTTTANPTYTWSAPSPAPSFYYYSLRVEQQNGGGGVTQDVIPAGTTSATSHPLGSGGYRWVLTVHDADDNESQVTTNFTVP